MGEGKFVMGEGKYVMGEEKFDRDKSDYGLRYHPGGAAPPCRACDQPTYRAARFAPAKNKMAAKY